MPMTNEQRNDAYRFFSIAFGAAPGSSYYLQLEQAYAAGMTTKAVVTAFTGKDQFLSIYPNSLSNQAFANLIVENVVGDSASTAAKADAKKQVAEALDAKWTRGDIVYQLFTNLAAKTADDADWAGTAKLMSNKVEVAKYVSEYRPLTTTDLSTLQNALKTVTKDTDVSSADAIKAVVAAAGVDLGGLKPQTSGADNYVGTAGNDAVDGGIGNDTLKGGDGNDVLIGGSGADSLYGERGQDYIEGGSGADWIDLGSYADAVSVPGYFKGNTYISGYIKYTFDASFEYADGGDGADTILGGLGTDLINGGEGADVIYGDGQSYYSEFTEGLGVSKDDLSHLYMDTIHGGAGDDRIYAMYGNDVVYGDEGNDTINGGTGNDYIDGGEGNDSLDGGTGSDTLLGGNGDDQLSMAQMVPGVTGVINGGAGNDTINLYTERDGLKAAITAGEGADTVSIRMSTDAQVSVDLTETVQSKDTLEVWWYSDGTQPLNPVVVKGFSLGNDVLNVDLFNFYGQNNFYYSYTSQSLSYDGKSIYQNYVQTVSNPSTPWLTVTGSGVDTSGKGIFVIKGAQAPAADVASVAAFLDPYGNNASYSKSTKHYFVFDIANVGMGVYLFTDDTGANAKIVADELTPLVVLTGVSTAQLDSTQPGFFMV
jgi:Ca2+-binding RTX toxin-like protein